MVAISAFSGLVRLSRLELRRPGQWGARWLAVKLDGSINAFFAARAGPG